MKVRSQLVLAFTYILLAVIVALTVPLAINLRARARAELVSKALSDAQSLAASVGAEGIPRVGQPAGPKLQQVIADAVQRLDGRVIVMNTDGVVLADEGSAYIADTPPAVGRNYDTPSRPEIVSALHRQTPEAEIRYSQTLGQDIMVAAAPVIDEGRLAGAVRISTNVQQVTDSVRRITYGVIVIGVSGLVAGLLIAFGLAGSLARPIARLASTARRLGSGDLSARAGDVAGASELQDLAHSFDDMAERVERTVQAQSEFVANASHQLRTPLTGMKLRLESAVAQTSNEDVRKQLEAADREVDRLSEIVARLLVVAREVEEGHPATTDLHEAAIRSVNRWRDRAERAEATIQTNGRRADAHADPADVDQILDNLLDNAIAYAPGVIEVETDISSGRPVLAVRDHGRGIPPEEQPRVTERFYRGKGTPPGGSGLGLAIARELTEKWGGTLVVSRADGGGTRVTVSLDMAPPA